jgi:O-antigen/teichoic acid export membrane protein
MANKVKTKIYNHNCEDLSGRNRIVWNTCVSWASHLVLVVSGFIMPRLMDEFVGQLQLGIWDFCWAFISYLSLIDIGVGASLNRYIAKYRAENKIDALNLVVSSAVFIEVFFSLAILLSTLVIVFTLPLFFTLQLGDNLPETQSVIFYLGLSVTFKTLFSTTRGLLTGHHRWDLHNALSAGYSFLSLCIMMTMLLAGFGILGMAQGYLISTIIFEFVRLALIRSYIRKMSISITNISQKTCLKLLGFSMKGQLAVLPAIILLQSVNIIIVNVLGAASLAIFSRPLALTRHISTFMIKFTMILTPTAGTLLSKDKVSELQIFFLKSTQFSFAFTLPLVIGLAIFGDIIISFWMGPDYVNWGLIALLSIGALLPTAQDSALRFLIAKNHHGKISLYATLIVMVTFFVGYMYLSEDDFTLISAAWLLIVPHNLAYGLAFPVYACNNLLFIVKNYIKTAVIKPIIYSLPYTLLLLFSKYFYLQKDYISTALCFACAVISLIYLYIFFLLTKPEKIRLYNYFSNAT